MTSETTIGEGGEQDTYTGGPASSPISPKWLYFGSYLTGTHSSGSTVSSSLFSLSYKGTYSEPEFLKVKNTVKSQYSNFEEDFEKQVFISQVGIFDEKKNLIGIAKLANPVLKKETDSYTFKLKLDL